MAPTVTIGLPVHNGERFLAEAIEAVLGQTFHDLELIVSDNASTDGTEPIARRYAGADPRVVYVRGPANRGAAWNYNHVVEMARGRYFKWQTHDDLIDPTYIEKCLAVLERDPGVALAYGLTRFIDENGQTIGQWDDRLHLSAATAHERLGLMLARAGMCNTVMGLMPTGVLRRTRGIDRFRGSDYVLLAELAMLGRIAEIPDARFYRRIHAGSYQRANRTGRAMQRWLDPSLGGEQRLAGVRLWLEFVRSVWRMELAPAERLACLWAVRQWPKARLRDMLGRYRRLAFSSIQGFLQMP